jgi:hypothetical protein
MHKFCLWWFYDCFLLKKLLSTYLGLESLMNEPMYFLKILVIVNEYLED